MREKTIKGQPYKLPGSLTPFQEEMYVHLINWKWTNITKEAGHNIHKGAQIPYDAILPEPIRASLPHIYGPIRESVKKHQKKFFFKFHPHFFHIASSQAANINLFVPFLLTPHASTILKALKPDFKALATAELDNGYRIEYWDGKGNEKGMLGDHTSVAGTDADIGIAYYNNQNELCLWLIEHKLTEKEFTECGGFKSKGRDKSKHLCEKPFAEILKNKHLCYYHDKSNYQYWNTTEAFQSFFVNHSKHNSCPFTGGMNQLWRNQLLGFALEKAAMFKEVYFSVVKHPENKALDKSIEQYKDLISHNNRFSVFDSKDVIEAAAKLNDSDLNDWLRWYKELYKI